MHEAKLMLSTQSFNSHCLPPNVFHVNNIYFYGKYINFQMAMITKAKLNTGTLTVASTGLES